jgi:hypothetical protein
MEYMFSKAATVEIREACKQLIVQAVIQFKYTNDIKQIEDGHRYVEMVDKAHLLYAMIGLLPSVKKFQEFVWSTTEKPNKLKRLIGYIKTETNRFLTGEVMKNGDRTVPVYPTVRSVVVAVITYYPIMSNLP